MPENETERKPEDGPTRILDETDPRNLSYEKVAAAVDEFDEKASQTEEALVYVKPLEGKTEAVEWMRIEVNKDRMSGLWNVTFREQRFLKARPSRATDVLAMRRLIDRLWTNEVPAWGLERRMGARNERGVPTDEASGMRQIPQEVWDALVRPANESTTSPYENMLRTYTINNAGMGIPRTWLSVKRNESGDYQVSFSDMLIRDGTKENAKVALLWLLQNWNYLPIGGIPADSAVLMRKDWENMSDPPTTIGQAEATPEEIMKRVVSRFEEAGRAAARKKTEEPILNKTMTDRPVKADELGRQPETGALIAGLKDKEIGKFLRRVLCILTVGGFLWLTHDWGATVIEAIKECDQNTHAGQSFKATNIMGWHQTASEEGEQDQETCEHEPDEKEGELENKTENNTRRKEQTEQ